MNVVFLVHCILYFFFGLFQSNVFRNSRFSSCSQAAVSGGSFLLDGHWPPSEVTPKN